MITPEHLDHWKSEIQRQLNSIKKEIAADKVKMEGINVGVTGEKWVSFEYLQEKSNIIDRLLETITLEMETDNADIIKKISDETRIKSVEGAEILGYFHCKNCGHGQLAVGWTQKGMQIFCERCNLNVANLDFMGQKIKTISSY